MSHELKPCPFCGNDILLKKKSAAANHFWHFIECPKCGCSGPKGLSDEHSVRWWDQDRVNHGEQAEQTSTHTGDANQ